MLLVLLAVALAFRHAGFAPYLLSLALAGLAGAIADWYAVTALFRHPLGMKWLPHTSIISANRERIIDALASLVETELLSMGFIESNITRLNMVQRMIQMMRREPSEGLARFFHHSMRDVMHMIPWSRVADGLKRAADRKADDVWLSDVLVRVLKWLIQDGHDKRVFVFLAHHAVGVLQTVEFTADMEARLKSMIEQYTKTGTQKFFLGILESLGTVDYGELSLSVKASLIRWLQSDKAFEQFELLLVRVMLSLRDDALVRQRVEEFKASALKEIPWEQLVGWASMEVDGYLDRGDAADAVHGVLGSLATVLDENPEYQEKLEAMMRDLALGLVRRYHPMIGRLVRDNLKQMDERDWIDKLEWYVGQDLQWIRLNGAIVGAIVGLLITVLTHLFRL